MSPQATYSHTKADKAINSEQLSQIVDAILAGKYSWACVLLLRFAGYNPLHYIPYRTYNRLIKENYQCADKNKTHSYPEVDTTSQKCLSQIKDLAVLEEVVDQEPTPIRGGSGAIYSPWNWHRIQQTKSGLN